MEPSCAPDPHRTNSVAIAIIIAIVFHRTADAPRNLSSRDRAIVAINSPEAPSDGADKTWKKPRSRSDRAVIAVRSSRDRSSFLAESCPIDRQAIDEGSGPRLWPDRGPIVARSWPDRGGNSGYLEAKLKPSSCRFVAELKPRFMHTESPPRRHQTVSTIASIAYDSKPNFLFKNLCTPSLKKNF